MQFPRIEIFLIVMLIIAVLAVGVSFSLQSVKVLFFGHTIVIADSLGSTPILPTVPPPPPPPVKLANPPEIIKAVYVTGYSAGTKKYLNYLSNLFNTTEINAVVVDVKGSDGILSYPNKIKDLDALVRFFHDKNIYVIGRIAVFEDPVFAKARPELAVYNKITTTDLAHPVLWQDNNKLSWLDPASKIVWDYNISLAKDALHHGFDEINFDYVRFPTDGNKDSMGFPVWDGKTPLQTIIKEFFQYTRLSLKGEKISADVFGQTTTNKDDMGIGQLLENAFENFDYISPMVYPSHYINGFMGFANPAAHPYEIIKYSMDTALAREKAYLAKLTATVTVAKFRPWLQDFNMGADYTASMVKQEIKATQDALGAEYSGYMLWNPSNIYNTY